MWRKSIIVSESQGISAAVTEWSRSGIPCILVHGFGDASCVWNHLAVRLASDFRVLTLDLRGHGDSDWDPDARYDTTTFTSDLSRIVSAYGFERLILVGHSLGADVVARFAAANAGRVAAAVLVDFGPELDSAGIDQVLRGFLETPGSFESLAAYVAYIMVSRPLGDPASLKTFARSTLRQAAPQAWKVKADPALGTRSQLSRLVVDEGRYKDAELWAKLAQIVCPSLVVRGSGSGVFPSDVANRMVERTMPNARLATIPRAGHAVMIDNPAGFSASVVDFLSMIPR